MKDKLRKGLVESRTQQALRSSAPVWHGDTDSDVHARLAVTSVRCVMMGHMGRSEGDVTRPALGFLRVTELTLHLVGF